METIEGTLECDEVDVSAKVPGRLFQVLREEGSPVRAGENLSLAFYAGSVDEFMVAVKRDQAYACIVIPENFQRDVVRGRAGRVTVLVDGSNVLIGNVAMRAISTTVASYRTGARSRKLLASGMPHAAAEAAAMPIQPVIRPLYNPTSHYGFFVLIGLVMVAIQQVTRSGTSIALSPEREPRNAGELRRIGGKTGQVLSAKLAATAVAVLPVSLIAIRLPFDLFGSPFRGSWLPANALPVVCVLMQTMIGYVFAGLCRSALTSLHVLLFASVPLFLLAGFTWPSYAMPQWVRALSWIIPLTHMLDMMRKMALMGAGISDLWRHVAVLAAWFPLAGVGSYWAYKSILPQAGGQPDSSS